MRSITDEVGLAADPIGDTEERAALRAELRRLITATSPTERSLTLDRQEMFDDELH